MLPETLVEIAFVAILQWMLVKNPRIFLVLSLLPALGLGYVWTLFHVDSGKLIGRPAMLATIFSPGSPQGVDVQSIEIPFHSDFQMLVKVKAAGLNPSNYKIVFPRIPFLRHVRNGKFAVGYDVSGVVENVGKECEGFKQGDKVFGVAIGSIAEYTIMMCEFAAMKPETLTFAEASGLPVVALTSLEAYDRSNLSKDHQVLVVGASGGCGIFGVLFGKILQAEVSAICSGKNIPFVKELGADHITDYTEPEQMKALLEAGKQFDVIYDTVSSFDPSNPNYEPELRPLLKDGGRYVAINGMRADWLRGAINQFITRYFGINIQRSNYDLFLLLPTRSALTRISNWYDDGDLAPHVK